MEKMVDVMNPSMLCECKQLLEVKIYKTVTEQPLYSYNKNIQVSEKHNGYYWGVR